MHVVRVSESREPMGQHATCNRCDFEFHGGHSHDSGASSCICLSCKALFECPTKNRWGPTIDEVIELVKVEIKGKARRHRTEKTSTGVTFVVERGALSELQIGDEPDYYLHYPIDEVACPQCRARKLVLGFELGDACPFCLSGSIETSFVEY